jgi:hypothetical protein
MIFAISAWWIFPQKCSKGWAKKSSDVYVKVCVGVHRLGTFILDLVRPGGTPASLLFPMAWNGDINTVKVGHEK